MKSWLYLAVLALPLGGCVLPPAVSLASLALDVGSFAATGKSATDHVISGIAGEDCRMMGVFEGEICREEQQFQAAVANLEPLRPLPEATPTAEIQNDQLAVARRAPKAPLPVEPPLALLPEPAPAQLAAEQASDVPALADLNYLAADLPRTEPGIAEPALAAQPTPRPELGGTTENADSAGPQTAAAEELPDAPAPAIGERRVAANPLARQVAALTPVVEEPEAEQPAASARGLVYGDNGQVLGVAYAFQNPLAGMDGNRESLNDLPLIDR